MKPLKERLVSEGNAFYEIDLECLKKKGGRKKGRQRKERGLKSSPSHHEFRMISCIRRSSRAEE